MFLLTGTGRSFIHGLKYHGDRSLLEDLPGFLDEVPDFKDHLKGAVIVPVPLHRRRLRSRGFNQSEWIAESIAACDNLFTTGATLEACARVLLEAGAKQVHVATLGHG